MNFKSSSNLPELAENLVEVESESKRMALLKKLPETQFHELALAIKNVSYGFWVSHPIKTRAGAKALGLLFKLHPSEEIKAFFKWIDGISSITLGKLADAVDKLDTSAETFKQIGKEHLSAQTQVSKLYALALLGQYDRAVETGKAAIIVFEKYNDKLAIGKIENNIGNIFIRQEKLYDAEKYFQSARKNFAAIKNTEQLLLSEIGLANTYSALNDFRRADKLYRKTLSNAEKSKMFLRQAEIETNIGILALYRGKYNEALKYLESSRQKYEILQMPHQTTIAELEIADIYLELNLAEEAFSIYKKVVDELSMLKLQGEEARARTNFSRTAIILQENETARRQLKKAEKLYSLERNEVGKAIVKTMQAKLALSQKKYQEALNFAEKAEKLLVESSNIRQQLTARWLQGEILRSLNERKKSADLLEKTSAEAITQEQPNLAQAAQTSLGKLFAAQKNYRKAESHFRKAIKTIETLRAPLPAEEFRMAFLADKLAPFENLAKIYLAENKTEKAFLTIEKARARSLLETIQNLESEHQILINEKFKNPAQNKNLVEKLLNLREELNWFYSRLNRADEAEIANLQREAKKREKQIADVTRQIESTKSGGAQVSANRANLSGSADGSRDLKQLQNQLGERKALIEFVCFDGILSAFVITDKKINFFADLAKESEIIRLLESLQFQFGAFRYGTKNLGGFIKELKKRADFYLQKLYEKLLKPLENFIGRRDLVVVPVAALHYIPFHALNDGENYVVETREVVYSPSAMVWNFLAAKEAKQLKNALLIGFADEKIPLVNQEIENLSGIFPKRKTFTGDKASFASFTKNAAKFDILHIACHGQFRPENPLFSSLHLADGWITVRDICSQKLNAGLVTLSACETGLNKIFAGDEILGLARGFLSAGASSLVLSLWTVSDEATARLMKDFYKNLQRGSSVSASLAEAQRNFIRREVHPYFWSPFALIGR